MRPLETCKHQTCTSAIHASRQIGLYDKKSYSCSSLGSLRCGGCGQCHAGLIAQALLFQALPLHTRGLLPHALEQILAEPRHPLGMNSSNRAIGPLAMGRALPLTFRLITTRPSWTSRGPAMTSARTDRPCCSSHSAAAASPIDRASASLRRRGMSAHRPSPKSGVRLARLLGGSEPAADTGGVVLAADQRLPPCRRRTDLQRRATGHGAVEQREQRIGPRRPPLGAAPFNVGNLFEGTFTFEASTPPVPDATPESTYNALTQFRS